MTPSQNDNLLFIAVSLLVIARVSLLFETVCHFRSPDSLHLVRFHTHDALAIQPLSLNSGQFLLQNVVQSFRPQNSYPRAFTYLQAIVEDFSEGDARYTTCFY